MDNLPSTCFMWLGWTFILLVFGTCSNTGKDHVGVLVAAGLYWL